MAIAKRQHRPSALFRRLALATALAASAVAAPLAARAADADKNGAEAGRWSQDYPAAQQLAKARNMPILLNFTGSDWCPWCKLMEREVFASDAWKAYAPSLVLAYIDTPTGISLPTRIVKQNAELKSRYNITGFPTYVLVDPDGNELARLGATQDPDPAIFVQKIRNAIPSTLVPKAAPPAPPSPGSPAANPYAPRTWTAASGATLVASYVSFDGRSVVLRLRDGSLSRIALDKLSADDQRFLQPLTGRAPAR